ncbi:MAG: stage V sporulation protein S [Eubacteriales bacterium]|nr:stage V sporulation protein S [Eubacteriales bacterium]
MIKNTQILKVGANTNLSDLKTSTFEHLRSDGSVILDAIGEKAAHVALRAVIFTQRQLPENVLINTQPGMVVVDTPEGDRKAVRLTLELKAS